MNRDHGTENRYLVLGHIDRSGTDHACAQEHTDLSPDEASCFYLSLRVDGEDAKFVYSYAFKLDISLLRHRFRAQMMLTARVCVFYPTLPANIDCESLLQHRNSINDESLCVLRCIVPASRKSDGLHAIA